ncbi:hypothetical protein [Paraflavitalea sp. CAU 1676]|uniref:hypothetical protein n=1 Tax=Paraflavitalea sp. CAU 1676 TaxID=3032598 RepID=UPI0023DAB70B|nr:hypothetical protein [Paraflavitalea sp. CAU 1676]MDF2187993.1 hypothetical protein [Paraflavitalea sp. CAU 1676]
MRVPLTCLAALAIFMQLSCKSVGFSKQEAAAVEKISNLYGGELTYSKSFKTSTDGNSSTFELQVAGSPFLEANAPLGEMFASHMAYTFYSYIKNEPKQYGRIQCSIVFEKHGRYAFSYDTDSLKIVDAKLDYLQRVANKLKQGGIDAVADKIWVGMFKKPEDKVSYLKDLRGADSTLGKVTGCTFAGFQFKEIKGIPVLHLSATLDREKQTGQFSINVNPKPDEYDTYLVSYEY